MKLQHTMNAATREKSSSYGHSSKLFQRRRSLFPEETADSETDSDLGHISPLSFDSSIDNDDINCNDMKHSLDDSVLSQPDTIGDYDIIGIVENDEIEACTPGNRKILATETMSPLYLSPHISDSRLTKTYVNETPSKISPTYKLKTPHDTSSTNSKLPKLARKSLSESSEIPSNKRKLSPYISPEQSKQIKLDPKSSKVRTTLFPEIDVSLSPKLFYSNTENIMDIIMNRKEAIPKSHNFPLTSSRKAKPRRKVTQMNKNVGHKIRKPKQKKSHKPTVVRNNAAVTIENAAITEFILDLKQLRNLRSEPVQLIENKENAQPIEPKPNTKQIVPAVFPLKTHSALQSRKRPVSPDTEPDHNKKFFKFSRSKGIVTMNKNFKVEVDHGKVTLLEKQSKNKPIATDFDLTDYDDNMTNTNLDNIISALEDEPLETEEKPTNKIVLQAHSSVVASDNSILLHQPVCPASLILSPISQMCDDTSGLAINSPKRAKNLNYILDRMPNASQNIFDHTPDRNAKLYPVFYGGKQVAPNAIKKGTKVISKGGEKKFRKLSDNQMLLDAGQKRFGVTQCHECNIIYHIGDPGDEAMHLHYHNSGHILRFQGWKNERVVADFQTQGRIIQIGPGDSKLWWKKSNDLMDLINQELGSYNMEFASSNCQMFLYIKNKMIVGCAVAIAKSEGHQMLSTGDNEADLCSEEKYPIRCGIPRIWVAHNYRRKGIATALMNTLKNNFIFGYALGNYEIAFSPPTELGKWFAQKYFGTPNFYIYHI